MKVPIFQSSYAEAHREAATNCCGQGRPIETSPRKKSGTTQTSNSRSPRPLDRRKYYNQYRDFDVAESARRAAAGEPFVVRFGCRRKGRHRLTTQSSGCKSATTKRSKTLSSCARTATRSITSRSSSTTSRWESRMSFAGRTTSRTRTSRCSSIRRSALTVPRFAHLPLILAPNKAKLSKRKHGEVVSVTTYRDAGFIPDAFINFLALLGWSPAGPEGVDREIFSRDELIDLFSLEGIHKSNAVFNFTEGDARNWTDQKALWMNAEYISKMPLAELIPMIRPQLEKAGLWQEAYVGERANGSPGPSICCAPVIARWSTSPPREALTSSMI